MRRLLALLVLAAACGSSSTTSPDGGAPDGGMLQDGGRIAQPGDACQHEQTFRCGELNSRGRHSLLRCEDGGLTLMPGGCEQGDVCLEDAANTLTWCASQWPADSAPGAPCATSGLTACWGQNMAGVIRCDGSAWQFVACPSPDGTVSYHCIGAYGMDAGCYAL